MGYNTTMAEDDAWEDGIVEPNDGQAGWSFSRQSSSRRKEPLEFDWEEEGTKKAELTDPKLDYRTRYNQWHDKLVKHSMYVSPTEQAEGGDMAGYLEANRLWEAKRKHYDWSDGYGRDTGSHKYKQPSKVWAEDHVSRLCWCCFSSSTTTTTTKTKTIALPSSSSSSSSSPQIAINSRHPHLNHHLKHLLQLTVAIRTTGGGGTRSGTTRRWRTKTDARGRFIG